MTAFYNFLYILVSIKPFDSVMKNNDVRKNTTTLNITIYKRAL